jgi:hypothetical protein
MIIDVRSTPASCRRIEQASVNFIAGLAKPSAGTLSVAILDLRTLPMPLRRRHAIPVFFGPANFFKGFAALGHQSQNPWIQPAWAREHGMEIEPPGCFRRSERNSVISLSNHL